MVGRVLLPPTEDDAERCVQVEAWQHDGALPVICLADELGHDRGPALPPGEALAISGAIATAAAAILTNTVPVRVHPDNEPASEPRDLAGSGAEPIGSLSS